ncbi:DUF438 domain-containing protein [Evansella cellulosilytica]|uniref:DUF438 domain-containing protein n=1 Tax=Evansella cellulosilytica (strain ATCC 21833 / DSM 2522 / FERM P-1141 / JCM 9156 / N-4) TaxID=649639 RepID=E6TV37_EVAC2|nr:DUF438 domain-containing protein [Evansella cellulosilytica]ADU28620.1 protein of unknown function DUF438 [Evansella cellulosilytica DSM 2522]
MSEIINNREQEKLDKSKRQEMLKEIIKDLHAGKSVEEVKQRFNDAVGTISVAEISDMEHSLMVEEGISVEEVQRLCSVHTEVFKGSIEEIHNQNEPEQQPGHPIHTFKLENRAIDQHVNFKLQLHTERFEKDQSEENIKKLIDDLSELLDIDKHYSRKENLLFPFLEKYGIFGPTKVMWGVDDRIRAAIKKARMELVNGDLNTKEIVESLNYIIYEVTEMIYKEENILFPMSLQTLTEDEWIKIANESDIIGYTFAEPAGVWKPERAGVDGNVHSGEGYIKLETGILTVDQLENMMNHLPVDITYIDKDDFVRYFSHGKERIFHRTKSVIGRTVQNCHPPQSAHIVNELLDDFKSGKKDSEDFWIKFRDKYVLIRYFAVKDKDGNYAGTLEFTQNIGPIQEITGEKRLMS